MQAERLAIVCDSVCFYINFICSIQSVRIVSYLPMRMATSISICAHARDADARARHTRARERGAAPAASSPPARPRAVRACWGVRPISGQQMDSSREH
eukprot:COSAG02_NODE_2891_length_7795_cov_50.476351_3_plen_98_part_00